MVFKFNSKIKGTSFRGEVIETLKNLQPNQTLVLVREPENKFDINAIKIYRGNVFLGYISKETAAKINKDVELGYVKCNVSEVTGGVEGKENYGCNILLEIDRPEEIKNV